VGVPRGRAWRTVRLGAKVAFMADKFPSDFYVTCATVIPVLFLAVAVQGRTWASFLRAIDQAYETEREATAAVAEFERRLSVPFVGADLVDTWGRSFEIPIVTIMMLIILTGGVGEFLALLALFLSSEFPGQRVIVFVGTLMLVAAVATVPYRTMVRGLMMRSRLDSQRRQHEAANRQSGEPPEDAGDSDVPHPAG
jgi:hypothetical protein